MLAVGFVLEHSGASLLFVGKLDNWPQPQAGGPVGLPCIALPLAPQSTFMSAPRRRRPPRGRQACGGR